MFFHLGVSSTRCNVFEKTIFALLFMTRGMPGLFLRAFSAGALSLSKVAYFTYRLMRPYDSLRGQANGYTISRKRRGHDFQLTNSMRADCRLHRGVRQQLHDS